MCELLWTILRFFCCCLTSYNKSESNSAKRAQKQLSPSKLYGTDWETKVHEIKTVDEIDDKMMSKEVNLPLMVYKDRISLYKYVLDIKGFDMVNDKMLGKGAFGYIYEVKHRQTGEKRAVKIIKMMGPQGKVIKHRFSSFKNEIFSLIKNKHKNIIELLDHFIVKDIFFSVIIMEFATGGDLNKRLSNVHKKTNTGFTEEEAKLYFVQVANALYFVHSNQLIHGDLKLENILITKINDKEVVKVSDFGCARVAVEDDEESKVPKVGMTSRAIGTLAYMSPEQLKVYICVNKKRPDLIKHPVYNYNPLRADVWSLGICFYRMLFYEFPFNFSGDRIKPLLDMIEQMRKGAQTHKNISESCVNILSKMIRYYKKDRYTMEQVMTDKWLADCPLRDDIKQTKRFARSTITS